MKRKREAERRGETELSEDRVRAPSSAKSLRTIEDVAGRTWSTYRTSPLHSFDEERLDAYAEGLRQLIAAECQRAVGPRWRFLSAVYAVARPEECGPIYAFVVGTQSVEEEGVLPEERPLLQAVMLRSRQSEPDAAENPAPYPVLLVRANKVFVDAFHSWFQSQFDCRITPLYFTPYALARMAALWGSSERPKGMNDADDPDAQHLKEPLGLVYQAPEYIPEIKTIKLTIPAEDMHTLAATMLENNANLYKEEGGLKETRPGLLRALEEHFFHHFRISLSAFLLCRISTPLAHLSQEGKVKMTEGNLPLVLEQLVRYAQVV